MSIAQGFGDVRSRMPWWILGGLVESVNYERCTALNKYPQAAQVTTVTVTDQGDNDTVTITINDVDIDINTDTGGDAASIGADLAEAINEEPLVRGKVTATFDTATLTLTGNTPGVAFDVSIANDTSTVLSAVTETTAADAADPIEFGRAVMRTGHQNTDELVAKVTTGLFTAQVITITPSGYVASSKLRVAVYEVRGSERVLLADVTETSATDLNTTLDALATSLNAQLPANSVVAASTPATATAITLTAEVPGAEIAVDVGAGDEGASVPTWTVAATTGPSEATSLHRALRGVALRAQGVGAATIAGNEQQCPANGALAYVRKGVVAVESAQSITAGDTVYVETAAGASAGKFYNSSSSTRVALSRARAVWERDANTGTGSLAALRLM